MTLKMQSFMLKKELKGKKSSYPEYSFLLNNNISQKIVSILKPRLKHNFRHISDFSKKSLTDPEVIDIAKREKHVIITHDLDYGEIYFLKERGQIGIIMLRLENQTSDNVISTLTKFFKDKKYQKYNLLKTLTIISDNKTRFLTF